MRVIRAGLHIGQARAQRLRTYLAALTTTRQADLPLEHPDATPGTASAA